MIKKFELGDIRRIINMIPQKRSEGIKYIRTEKSGYYSLLSNSIVGSSKIKTSDFL